MMKGAACGRGVAMCKLVRSATLTSWRTSAPGGFQARSENTATCCMWWSVAGLPPVRTMCKRSWRGVRVSLCLFGLGFGGRGPGGDPREKECGVPALPSDSHAISGQPPLSQDMATSVPASSEPV